MAYGLKARSCHPLSFRFRKFSQEVLNFGLGLGEQANGPKMAASRNRAKFEGMLNWLFCPGGPVKLDSMWQHRLTRPLHVQHTYYRIIFKQNPFNIISRGVQC